MKREAAEGSWADRHVVFVSYAHEDAEWAQAFQVMLEPVLGSLGLNLWIDIAIRAGDQWDDVIEEAIAQSGLALLLVSARYVSSEYIRKYELPELVNRRVRLTPVLIGACLWDQVPELVGVQWLHGPDSESALNLIDRVGERDKQIWRACTKLLEILPGPQYLEDPDSLLSQMSEGPPTSTEGVASVHFGIPDPPPGYVEREELTELVDILLADRPNSAGLTDRYQRIGLHGQGGIGKSVLAAALCRAPRVLGSFPDGIFWVTLGQYANVLNVQVDLLARLDPRSPRPRNADEAQRVLRQALSTRRILLVVDDVWSDAAAQAFCLTGPQGRLLFTTRDIRVILGVGARPVQVEMLSVTAARALAIAVVFEAATSNEQFQLPPEADLAFEEVGRIALAVALVAAAVRGGRTWDQLAEALAETADIFGDHPYSNTFKAMQLAVATLPDHLAEALYGLAVFPRNTRTPVLAVWRYWSHVRGCTADETKLDLERLAAAQMLILDHESVEFHDLRHEYLLLHAPALSVLHSRLVDAYRILLPGASQWWQLPLEEPYIWDRLTAHLRGAGARRELAALVSDPAFLVIRIACSGLIVAENDIAIAYDLQSDSSIGWLKDWLSRHADVLYVPSEIEAAIARVRRLVATFLAWLRADTTRPAHIDLDRLRPLLPSSYLSALWGLKTPTAAPMHVLNSPGGPIRTLDWCPDGSSLAIGDTKGVRLWNEASGYSESLLDSDRPVLALAWSPDGSHLAIGTKDGKLRVWGRASNRIATLSTSLVGSSSVAWSHESSRIAASVSSGVEVWNLSDDTRMLLSYGGYQAKVWKVAWDPNGLRLVGAGTSGVAMWDLSGMADTAISGHTREVTAIAWSPDGRRLATAGVAGIRIWDPLTRRIKILRGPEGVVNDLAWSPDGVYFACAAERGYVLMCSLIESVDEWSTVNHPGAVFKVAWAPDRNYLATVCEDGRIRIWGPRASQGRSLKHNHNDNGNDMEVIAWSPDGTKLAAGGATSVEVIDPATREILAFADAEAITKITWSPDGRRLAVAGRTGSYLWAPAYAKMTSLVPPLSLGAQSVAWSPGGDCIAIGMGSELWLWDPGSFRVSKVTEWRFKGILAVAWFADNDHLAVATSSGIWIHRRSTGSNTLIGSNRGVRVLAVSRHGVLAGGGEDEVVLWTSRASELPTLIEKRLQSGRSSTTFVISSHIGAVDALAWADADDRLAVAGPAGEIVIYDLGGEWERHQLNIGPVSSLSWAADRIVACSSGNVVMLNIVSSSELRTAGEDKPTAAVEADRPAAVEVGLRSADGDDQRRAVKGQSWASRRVLALMGAWRRGRGR